MNATMESYMRNSVHQIWTFTTKDTSGEDVADVVWDPVNDLPETQTVSRDFPLHSGTRGFRAPRKMSIIVPTLLKPKNFRSLRI